MEKNTIIKLLTAVAILALGVELFFMGMPVTQAAPPDVYNDYLGPIKPHYSHISLMYHMNSWPSYTSADKAFLEARVDHFYAGDDHGKAGAEEMSQAPSNDFFPYTILLAVPIVSKNNYPPNLSTPDGLFYGDVTYHHPLDMQSWYANHPQYNLEDAFLHNVGAAKTEANRRAVTIWPTLKDSTGNWVTDNYWCFNPTDPGMRAYQIDRLNYLINRYPPTSASGVFIDVMSVGPGYDYGSQFTGYPERCYWGTDQYPANNNTQNSQITADINSWLTSLRNGINNKILYINISIYTMQPYIDAARISGAAHLEKVMNPFAPMRYYWDQYAAFHKAGAILVLQWGSTDADINSTSVFKNYSAGNESSRVERERLFDLANYYMIMGNSSTDTWFNPGGKALWYKAYEANVGTPTSGYTTLTTGTDPRGQAYTVYQRNFSKALVVVRPQQGWSGTTYYDDSTAADVALPAGSWYTLHMDGTLTGPFATIQLRASEAAILFNGTGGPTPTPTPMPTPTPTPTPAADTQAPSIPTGLTATAASSTQINLSWNASIDNVGVSKYNIFRSGIQIGTATTTSYANTGLLPFTTYTYTVSAQDAAGNQSAQSGSVSKVTLSTTSPSPTPTPTPGPDIVPPTVAFVSPTNGSTVYGTTDLKVNASDNIGVAGVQYYLKSNFLGAEVTSSPFTFNWDTTHMSDGIYTLYATARDAAGNRTTTSSISLVVNNANAIITPTPTPTPVVTPTPSVNPTPTPTSTPTPTGQPGPQPNGSPVFFNGVLVKSPSNPTVYWSHGGTLVPIANYPALQLNFPSQPVLTLPDTAIATQTVSQTPVTFPSGALIQPSGSQQVFLVIQNGTKYPFRSYSEFQSFGYQPNQIVKVDADQAVSIPNAPFLQLTYHPDGTFLKFDNNPTVYEIKNQQLLPIPSFGVLLSYTTPDKIAVVPSNSVFSYALGAMLTLPDGVLVKGSSPTVYLITNGQKSPFASAQAFLNNGFNFKQVINVSDGDLQAKPDGQVIQ